MSLNILDATVSDADMTPEVSTRQLRQILTDRSAIVVDTRSRDQFEAGHIPGARDLDAAHDAQVAAVEEITAGTRSSALILYCNSQHCKASRRLADQLVAAGFINVKRYQLGIAIWRALGGPTAVELGGIKRIIQSDQSAVFIDARARDQFAQGSLPGAQNLPVELLASAGKLPLPDDDFSRRIIIFGGDAAQARRLADGLSLRPWHNVAYFPGSLEALKSLIA